MQFKQLLNDDDAVSPVIGVILMVAITVILAAVIGTFVLGLGDQVQTTAPNANFQFDFDSSNDELSISHTGGDGIDSTELILAGEVDCNSDCQWGTHHSSLGDTVQAGDTVSVASGGPTADSYGWSSGSAPADGDEVRVVWQDADSDQSSTMRTWTHEA